MKVKDLKKKGMEEEIPFGNGRFSFPRGRGKKGRAPSVQERF